MDNAFLFKLSGDLPFVWAKINSTSLIGIMSRIIISCHFLLNVVLQTDSRQTVDKNGSSLYFFVSHVCLIQCTVMEHRSLNTSSVDLHVNLHTIMIYSFTISPSCT